MSLKDRITELFVSRPEITQKELAKACGIKPASVNDWLTGKTLSMKAETCLCVSKFFGINPQWLATGIGKKHADQLSARESELKKLDDILIMLPDEDFERIKTVCEELAKYSIQKKQKNNGTDKLP